MSISERHQPGLASRSPLLSADIPMGRKEDRTAKAAGHRCIPFVWWEGVLLSVEVRTDSLSVASQQETWKANCGYKPPCRDWNWDWWLGLWGPLPGLPFLTPHPGIKALWGSVSARVRARQVAATETLLRVRPLSGVFHRSCGGEAGWKNFTQPWNDPSSRGLDPKNKETAIFYLTLTRMKNHLNVP